MITKLLNNSSFKSLLLITLLFGFEIRINAQVNNVGTTVNGQAASAIGQQTKSLNWASFASGYKSEAKGQFSTAIGLFATVDSSSMAGIAFGKYVRVSGPNSVAIGVGYENYPLYNNLGNSLMVGFNSTKPTLFVGPNETGTSDGLGKIGVGTTTPGSLMQVNGNVAIGYNNLTVAPNNGMCISGNVGIGTSTPSQKLEVQGNVFINDENSGLILKSQDGTQWKLRINNDGQLEVVQAENMEDLPQTETIDIFPNPANESIQLSLAEKNFPVHVKVYDMEGILIYMRAFYSNDIKINISAFPQGNYVLQVINHNQQVTQSGKFVKM